MGDNIRKVCLLTSVHPADDIRIFAKEGKLLVQEGYSVTLIAQDDFNRLSEGIRILALPKVRKRLRRFFISFQLLFFALRVKADIYHFHDPELIPAGIVLKIFGRKVVYDVHEDYPQQILTKYWVNRYLKAPLACFVKFAEFIGAAFFDGIVAATPDIAKRFPADKCVLVQNFPVIEDEKRKPYNERLNYISYIGGISETRGIFEVIKAVELLPEYLNIRLKLAGNFIPAELRYKLESLGGWNKIDYLGFLPHAEIMKLLGDTRIGLVILRPLSNYLVSYPVKLFEYMMAGVPVVASDFPLWRKIIDEAGCGVLVDFSKPQSIANTIQWLFEHPGEAETMGKKGQLAVRDKYNWEKEATKLLKLYDKL